MAKSLTEFARELGVTRQHVGRLAATLPPEMQPEKIGREKFLSPAAQRELLAKLSRTSHMAQESSVIDALIAQLEAKDRQIAALNQHLGEADAALAREQELHRLAIQRGF